MVQQNPARRGRSRTQPSRQPSKETGSEKGPDARRARERETDRQSQRHHRERQRHYVKQLEETVEAYKSSLSEFGDVNVAALLAEQEELRRRCSELGATLIRIRTLAGSVSGSVDNIGIAVDANKSTSPGELQPNLSSPLFAGKDNEKDNEKENDNSALPCLDPIFGAAPVEAPTPFFPQEPVDFALLSADFSSLPAQESYSGEPRVTEIDPAQTDQSLSVTENVDGCEDVLDSDDFNQCLASIIDEGCVQRHYGHFDTTAPSLRRLLSDESTDVVASRLFHYICSSGPMPLHQLMSIFWVQYLVLRWYILGTLGDFMRMPAFLRPTDLETRIPHRPCIAMLAGHSEGIDSRFGFRRPVRKMQADRIKILDVREGVVDQLDEYIDAWQETSVFSGERRSWYKDNTVEGRVLVWGGSNIHFLKTIKAPRWEHYDMEYLGANPWAFLGNGRIKAEAEASREAMAPYLRNSDTPWTIE